MMFHNNNSNIVRRLSKRSFRANKSRNLFIIAALILTTFMITSVFSIGFSYTKTNELHMLRMMGTTAHTALTYVTEEQAAQLEKQTSIVSAAGLSQRLGSAENEGMGDALLGLVWINESEWKQHRQPTITGVTGSYPTAQNEVMLPTWALSKLGISKPIVGMEISLGYRLTGNDALQTESFRLSGYYTDYAQIRTGNRGSIYVSESFRKATGIPLEDGGAAMITFRDNQNINAYCEQLKSGISLGEKQAFEEVPLYQQNDNSMMVLLGGAIVIITIAGYLLIYNILYISVSKDIRFYGQLKTLGTTKEQIKRLILLQVFKVSAIGIPLGLLLGAAVSFGLVPLFLTVFSEGDSALGISISFSPFLFVFAGVFAFLTVMAASLKPAHIAAVIPPVEAMKFVGVQSSKRKERKSVRGAKLAFLAWRNIFRNRKSAILVFSSLFFGLTLFLLSTGLLGSLSPSNFAAEYLGSDITVMVKSASANDVLTKDVVKEINQQKGVQ